MTPRLPLLLSAAVVSLLALASAQGQTPCHSNRSSSLEPSCTSIRMPPSFSSACVLRPPLANGDFVSCSRIYDLESAACRAAFEAYVALNPCDGVRAAFVAAWGDPAAMLQLDYFAYALAEQCCDNVEAGSLASEYDERNRRTPSGLWSLTRGNGPAHFYYDIALNLFPNFKYFNLGGKPGTWAGPHEDWPLIKPLLEKWQNSDKADNWVENANADIPWEIKRVLNHAMYALECHNYNTWTRCLDLESKQSRVR